MIAVYLAAVPLLMAGLALARAARETADQAFQAQEEHLQEARSILRLDHREELAPDEPIPPRYAEYVKRMEHEVGVINNMGFAGYFLIVADFIDYARRNGIPVGPGRGSSAGSLAAWALGITGVDPIEYDIIFERFLNPERISMPDIDVDFCMRGRDDVIRYVARKYDEGESDDDRKVAQIITFGKLQARAAIRDVGRVLGMPYGDVDRIAKLIPETLGITLAEAVQQSPDLRARMGADGQVRHLVETAQRLEGLTRHASTHAAGVVIGTRPLIETGIIRRLGGETFVWRVGREDAVPREIWSIDIETTGKPSDLAEVVPVMLAAAQPYVGESTDDVVQVRMNGTDRRIDRIKGAD